MQPGLFTTSSRFDGMDITPADQVRLSAHLLKLTRLMADQRYRTLKEIAEHVGCTEASASARLRDLRKRPFGSFTVNRQRVHAGLWAYQVIA